MERRDFLRALAAPVWALGAASCAVVPTYRARLLDGRLLVDEAAVAPLWQQSAAIIVRGGRQSAVLLRLAAGQYRALEADCPHQGCQVRPAAAFITCPCHGSTFDLHGRLLRGPARRPLRHYAIARRDGLLEIAIPSPRGLP